MTVFLFYLKSSVVFLTRINHAKIFETSYYKRYVLYFIVEVEQVGFVYGQVPLALVQPGKPKSQICNKG